MRTRTLLLPVLLISAFSFFSCKKDTSHEPAREFKVRMTDSPGDYTALYVQILSVDALHEDGDWVNLNNVPQAINVLELTNGEEMMLAERNVRPGIYSKLRITFAEQGSLRITKADPANNDTYVSVIHPLRWEGPDHVTLDIGEDVRQMNGADVLLDFNVAASVTEHDDHFHLSPFITVITDRTTGIRGDVEDGKHAAVTLTRGDEKYSTYTDQNGKFLMRGIPEGVYDVKVIPERELNAAQPAEYRVSNVLVTRGSITNLGTIDL